MDHKTLFKEQYGINVSVARSRLIKLLLFDFVVKSGKNQCYRCNKEMTVVDFSIEHMKPWAREPNAYELFMDINNISYSHTKCNVGHTRSFKRPKRVTWNETEAKCSKCKIWKSKDEFDKNSTSPRGLESLCKGCRKDYRKS